VGTPTSLFRSSVGERSGQVERSTGSAIPGPHLAPVLPPVEATRYRLPSRAAIHFPERLTEKEFYAEAYPVMYRARRLEERMIELFQKGYVKGTVATGAGNEAVAVGMALPLRPGADVVSFMHRDMASHLLFGSTLRELLCQYMANAESPTHAREGNVHHGVAHERRFPMISHLGKMPSLVVGGAWEARRQGEEVFGLAVVGDGGTSTGEIHESLNLASVHRVPVLFVIENNLFAFSTPTDRQYRVERLSDRAAAYGIRGLTIDGADAYGVYQTVWDLLAAMAAEPAPAILECMTLRLHGHAAYDKAEYVSRELLERWRRKDPVPAARRRVAELYDLSEQDVRDVEAAIDEEIHSCVAEALAVARPDAKTHVWQVHAESKPAVVPPVRAQRVKNGAAVKLALDAILSSDPRAFLAGLDVGEYGSAFKTCKGLIDRHGAGRVLDMPIAESAMVGFALGASQLGGRPIVEFQFADFSTEAVTQVGLNAGTWYFRSGSPAPILFRLPCGGGLTMGAFHSGEFEGLWSRFPGLKILYPATAQETFEALLAGFDDPNPCVVLEHKQLYWSRTGDIDFDGRLDAVWRARRYIEGSDLTILATGAMVYEALTAAERCGRSVEVINPFVLQPLDVEALAASVRKTGRLMVVQESGTTQGLGDRLISLCVGQAWASLRCRPRLVAAPDVPVPFAPELESFYRPDAERILGSIEEMFAET
jgi:2-oxoisovalerate dehydrogenase E1 component